MFQYCIKPLQISMEDCDSSLLYIYIYIYIYIGVYLCGLVVRVSGYRYRGPGFDSQRYQIF